ncbi:ABC transporter permease [Microbacterium oxydans]|uniref:Putative D,D-dipeptide transport system permease protein DdpC n=1 Tax=Microbacterium oxydans TaxID=82380 RepID=A0A0F0L9L7_9MICO|nr:ABC transporter permease [Microbacterium oxydans]KJL29828.1 putative D,D-dipeptide transport system permease protein DdpC [Microbacterium oxydans]
MSETTALLPDAAERAVDTFALTSADRFEDAVADRAHRPRARRLIGLLRRPVVLLATVWLALIVIAALWPGLLAPGDPLLGVPADKLQAPSAAHLFGTDQIGRDLYTRVVHGTQLTLSAAAIAVGGGMLVGALLGVIAGFAGGRIDELIMRGADVLLAIPGLLLSLAIITALGFGTVNVAIAVGAASVASVARIMRSEVLRVRSAPYVEAAQASGNRWLRVLGRHVLPNSLGPVVVLSVLELGGAILAVSSLSFLGYGAQPPLAEWGSLVSGGRDYLRSAWWLTTFPGIAIALTVLSANRLSRALDSDRGVR